MSENAIVTNNKHGFTYHLSPFGKDFVSFAGSCSYPVMDIGSAYGVASIPALELGAKVIAIDLEESHLIKLIEQVPFHLRDNITTIKAKFPDIEFPDNSVGAVYMSQILPFLNGEKIEDGIKKVYDWLVPGGKLFIVSFTPFIAHVSDFLPIYEQRKRLDMPWAGYIDDVSKYSNDPSIYKNLPNQINHVDKEDIQRVCMNVGFEIEKLEYFGDPENYLPKGIKYEDKERVGLIARRPLT